MVSLVNNSETTLRPAVYFGKRVFIMDCRRCDRILVVIQDLRHRYTTECIDKQYIFVI